MFIYWFYLRGFRNKIAFYAGIIYTCSESDVFKAKKKFCHFLTAPKKINVTIKIRFLLQFYRFAPQNLLACLLGWNFCGFGEAKPGQASSANNFQVPFTRDTKMKWRSGAAQQRYNFVNYPCKTSHLLSPYSRSTQSHISSRHTQKIFIFCMLQAPFIFMLQKKYLRWCFFFFSLPFPRVFIFVIRRSQEKLFSSDSKDNNAGNNRLILYS